MELVGSSSYVQNPAIVPYREPHLFFRHILVLCSHIHLGLNSRIFLEVFPNQTLYAFLTFNSEVLCNI